MTVPRIGPDTQGPGYARWLGLCQNCGHYRLFASQAERDDTHNTDPDLCACSDCLAEALASFNEDHPRCACGVEQGRV